MVASLEQAVLLLTLQQGPLSAAAVCENFGMSAERLAVVVESLEPLGAIKAENGQLSLKGITCGEVGYVNVYSELIRKLDPSKTMSKEIKAVEKISGKALKAAVLWEIKTKNAEVAGSKVKEELLGRAGADPAEIDNIVKELIEEGYIKRSEKQPDHYIFI